MPNNNIISPEQKRKEICFRVAIAKGNLQEVRKYCDAYTLNAVDAKGNTPLHLVSEQGHDEILKFLFQQPGINFHQLNKENKKAVDLIKDLSIAELFKKKLNESEEITKDDLITINAYVKEAVYFGAPNWMQEQFPHQNSTAASKWEKNNPDYYRIDVLQEIFLGIKAYIEPQLEGNSVLDIILRIFHASLTEVLQVGRCDEQVAVAFNQFLLTEKKAKLEWVQAVNLEELGGQNFIVINGANNIKKPNTWKKGLLIDPMDDRVENLEETTTKLMDHLTRIISQADAEKIELQYAIGLNLPLRAKHHTSLINFLKTFKKELQVIFKNDWDNIWSHIRSSLKKEHDLTLLPLEEKTVKEWVDSLWKSIEKKIEIHTEMKNKLEISEDTIARLTQRKEVLLNAEFAQMAVRP